MCCRVYVCVFIYVAYLYVAAEWRQAITAGFSGGANDTETLARARSSLHNNNHLYTMSLTD